MSEESYREAVLSSMTERRDGELILKEEDFVPLPQGAVVFGAYNGDWKVGYCKAGKPLVYTGVLGVEGWQLVCRPNSLRYDTAEEVAHFIAAAPDLYMALKGAVRLAKERHLAGNELTPEDREWFVDAVKAIEKADRPAITEQLRKSLASHKEAVTKEGTDECDSGKEEG